MYKIFGSESNKELISEMNKLEKEGYKMIASHAINLFNYHGLTIIMYKEESE